MTITLELPPRLETELRESVARQDAEAVRRILSAATAPIAASLLLQAKIPVTLEEYDAVLAEIDADFAAIMGPDAPILSDYATSREGIYEDHA